MGDSGGAGAPLDVMEDLVSGGALLPFEGVGRAAVRGEKDAFVPTPGAETRVAHARSGGHGEGPDGKVRDGTGREPPSRARQAERGAPPSHA